MNVRDLHSDLSSAMAMARHPLKLTGSPLQIRAFFNARPHVISGYPLRLEGATQPVSNCSGARPRLAPVAFGGSFMGLAL